MRKEAEQRQAEAIDKLGGYYQYVFNQFPSARFLTVVLRNLRHGTGRKKYFEMRKGKKTQSQVHRKLTYIF